MRRAAPVVAATTLVVLAACSGGEVRSDPTFVGRVPQVTLRPAQGPVGARVRFEGSDFTDRIWKRKGATLTLVGTAGCGTVAEVEHAVTVSPTGRLEGELTVPEIGTCGQGDAGDVLLTAGRYRIVFACPGCTIAHFEITGTSSRCADRIVAFDMPCDEAEAFVRSTEPQFRAVGDSGLLNVEGFSCFRTAQSTFWCEGRGRRLRFVVT